MVVVYKSEFSVGGSMATDTKKAKNDASVHSNDYGRSQSQPNSVRDSEPATNYRGQADDYQVVNNEETNDFTGYKRRQLDNKTMQVGDGHQKSSSWYYGRSSNVKSLEKIEDAHKYVEQLVEIFQVPSTMDGDSFVADLHQAIEDGTKEYCREYLIKDEEGTKTYIVAGVRGFRGQRRDIFHCIQQLTDGSTGNVGIDNKVKLNGKPSIQWFRTKARESLKLHGEVIQASHTLSIDMGDGQYQNNTGRYIDSNHTSSKLPCSTS